MGVDSESVPKMRRNRLHKIKMLKFKKSLASELVCVVMRGTPPALQIAVKNFPLGDVGRGENGELSKNGHRSSIVY